MPYGGKGYSNKSMGGRSMQKSGGSVLEMMKKKRDMKMRSAMKGQMTGRKSSTGY